MSKNSLIDVSEDSYLKLLAKSYPTVQSVSTEIINLSAILDLPKGTEYFISDIHGEYEAFDHIMNNASGVIREKVEYLYGDTLSQDEQDELVTIIYYPEEKMDLIEKQRELSEEWYRTLLFRLIEISRLVSAKYTRSKVRKALPKDYEYIIDELMHTQYDYKNKEEYYNSIIGSIIDVGAADSFIYALSNLIKRLVIDRLHIVGDIFDRGPRADHVVERLMQHHNCDVQWGNHDILWMGAAAGSAACIANIIRLSLRYDNLDVLENGYGINLRPLTMFAQETYTGDCRPYAPKFADKMSLSSHRTQMIAKIHKAISIIQFKLEGQLIKRNPDYRMEHRLLFDMIDYDEGTITISGKTYELLDPEFPTVDPKDPYRLTPEEEEIIQSLCRSVVQNDKLQRHAAFLLTNGSLYKIINSNLLYHGCIPMDPDGSFTEVIMDGVSYSGKSWMDYVDRAVRSAYLAEEGSEERRKGRDFIWYLWCGKNSPIFGRDKMTTLERYLIEDQSSWTEPKNAYYKYRDDEAAALRIFEEFGMDTCWSHIINGHEPVKIIKGENPVKAGGKIIVIDGGFCKAYQPTTGIAGYTLVYNSRMMRLICHEPFVSIEKAIEENLDIHSTSTIFDTPENRQRIRDTDDGQEIIWNIIQLKRLLAAYKNGDIAENKVDNGYNLK